MMNLLVIIIHVKKMKTTSKQQEILQEMDQTFDSNDGTTVQNYE